MELAIRGRVLLGGRIEATTVGIEGGRIAVIGRHLEADRVLDVGDALVLPGAIDLHVHFRDPGHPEKEDFGTGSLAAAHGGVTTVLDMPNTTPATTTPEALVAKRRTAEAKSLVDFGLYGGLTDDPASADLLDHATAMKAYLGATTGDLLVGNEKAVAAALEASRRTGRFVAFHAESDGCLHHHGDSVRDRHDAAVWADARPDACEADAISLVKRLLVDGGRPHIAHLSTRAGLDVLGDAPITKEVTPHHLFATRDELAADVRWKMNPPLRTAADRATLWDALASGRIEAVASDHAPHLPAEKDQDVWEAPAGVPGVETMLPLVLQAVNDGRLPLARAVDALAGAPARIAGLPKGRIAVGYDADIVVVDPKAPRVIRADELHSRCNWTPYEGMQGVFPRHVLVRGRFVVEDDATVGRPGHARFQEGARHRREAENDL